MTDGMDSATHYAVARITDGKMLYRGTDLSEAAKHLTPGTCYGSGPDQYEAGWQAAQFYLRERRRAKIRKAKE